MKIISPGSQALVVDLGRPGHRHLGVPLGGAADRLSFQIANWLVGNAPDTGAVEATLGGLRVELEQDATIAVTGAEADMTINSKPAALWTAHSLKAGAQLNIGATRLGVRNILAVSGGIRGDMHFGSLSAYPPAGLGANGGKAFAKGDRLNIGQGSDAPNSLPAAFRPRLSNHVTLRARSVSEYERLSAEAQRRLFVRPWRAGRATSRMGTRLKGGALDLADTSPMISSPLLPGTLQVPPGGTPILSLVDGHCTGGYVRALQVIAPDMWVAGQIGPGTTVSFHRAFAPDVPHILDAHLAQWGSLIEGYRL